MGSVTPIVKYGTSAMVYVQSGQQTIADDGSGVAATYPTYNYVYASYIDEPVLRDDGTNLRYFHRNGQNKKKRFITERNGASHRPYEKRDSVVATFARTWAP